MGPGGNGFMGDTLPIQSRDLKCHDKILPLVFDSPIVCNVLKVWSPP